MENLVNFISNNFYIILVIAIILVLALIGYAANVIFKKDFTAKVSFKDLHTDLEEIDVGENKSLGELLNKPSELDKLNMD